MVSDYSVCKFGLNVMAADTASVILSWTCVLDVGCKLRINVLEGCEAYLRKLCPNSQGCSSTKQRTELRASWRMKYRSKPLACTFAIVLQVQCPYLEQDKSQTETGITPTSLSLSLWYRESSCLCRSLQHGRRGSIEIWSGRLALRVTEAGDGGFLGMYACSQSGLLLTKRSGDYDDGQWTRNFL